MKELELKKLGLLKLKKQVLIGISASSLAFGGICLFDTHNEYNYAVTESETETESMTEVESTEEYFSLPDEKTVLINRFTDEKVGLEKETEEETIETETEEPVLEIEHDDILEQIYLIKAEREQNLKVTHEVLPISSPEGCYLYINDVRNNYGAYIDKYANKYGIDPAFLTAIICQENPTNITTSAAAGLTQIAECNNGVTYRVFDEELGCYTDVVINTYECRYNPETSIKCGAAIIRWIYDETKKNNINGFSSGECLVLALNGYNKGMNRATNAARMFSNYKDAYYYANDYIYINGMQLGDINYINHVLKNVTDGHEIQIKDYKFDENGNYIGYETSSLIIDNSCDDKYIEENDYRKTKKLI